MSLEVKIHNLIADITDPSVRIDIASTLYYLADVYASGKANEDEIRDSLLDICATVIGLKEAGLTHDEIMKKARAMVEELMRAFRAETMRRRTLSRYSMRFRL